MITHKTEVRVRYGETDQMGFLYHARYVDLFDVGRTELMRHRGLSNAQIEAQGVMLPVIKVEVNYKNPAYYDELLTVVTTLTAPPRATITFDYQVFRPCGELITTGAVTLAFMNAATRKAIRCPGYILELFNESNGE